MGGAIYYQWSEIGAVARSPAGAVTAELTFWATTTEISVDDVSLIELSVMHDIVLADDGVTADGAPVRETIAWGASQETGVDQNHNTSNDFTGQTMVLRVVDPIKLSGILWDIRQAGDYELHQLYAPGLTNSWRVLWSGTGIVANSEVEMTFASPEVLMPGVHYLALKRTTGATTWCDYNSPTYIPANPSWMFDGLYYNATSYNYVPGAKLIWQKGIWS